MYIRSAQADAQQAVDGQRSALLGRAAERRWQPVGEYVDLGSSGATLDRRALTELLDRIERHGDIDAVAVHDLSRLSRDTDQLIQIKRRLRTCNVRVISLTELDAEALLDCLADVHAVLSPSHPPARSSRRLPVAGHIRNDRWDGDR
jgi:DNA invertase Pin-like site-specific DNA recombinase